MKIYRFVFVFGADVAESKVDEGEDVVMVNDVGGGEVSMDDVAVVECCDDGA